MTQQEQTDIHSLNHIMKSFFQKKERKEKERIKEVRKIEHFNLTLVYELFS